MERMAANMRSTAARGSLPPRPKRQDDERQFVCECIFASNVLRNLPCTFDLQEKRGHNPGYTWNVQGCEGEKMGKALSRRPGLPLQ